MDLEATLHQLAPGLLRYCLGRLGDGGDAEDVAQEALAALVQRWRRLGPPESPAGFVFRLARRRSARRLARRHLLRPLEVLADASDKGADPATRAAARHDLKRIRRALAGLRPLDREVLLLIAVADLERARVAEVLGISQGALKMRLHRARRRLAELMESSDAGRRQEQRANRPRCFEGTLDP